MNNNEAASAWKVGDRARLKIKARDVGRGGVTVARFDPERGREGVVTELFADGHGLRQVHVQLDRPNLGSMWLCLGDVERVE